MHWNASDSAYPAIQLASLCQHIPEAMTVHTDTKKNLKTVHFPPFIFFLEAPTEPPSPIGGDTWAVGPANSF